VNSLTTFETCTDSVSFGHDDDFGHVGAVELWFSDINAAARDLPFRLILSSV
jgi:hypothetical protein